jgi:hypothetical protein
LEQLLRQKEAEVQLLESEKHELQQKEQTLQRAIASVDGSVHAFRLFQQSGSSASNGSRLVSSAAVPALGHCVAASPEAEDTMDPFSCRTGDLQQLQDTTSSAGSFSELYTTQLLLTATADAEQAAAIAQWDRSTRLTFLKQNIMRLGVLLPKYDLPLVGAASCSWRKQVDELVDDILRTMLTWMTLDGKQYMSLAMVNLESQQQEPFPPGHWLHVAKVCCSGHIGTCCCSCD